MKTYKVVYSSIYIAIIAILSFVPQVGYIKIGPIFFTTIIFILVIATYHLGFIGSIVSSVSFGVFSFLTSISINPSLLADPVLLIVPRIILGFLIYSICKLLGKISLWKAILLTICTVILNTTLISAFVFIVSLYNNIFDKGFYFWISLIYVNFLIELLISIILIINCYKIIIYIMNKKNNW